VAHCAWTCDISRPHANHGRDSTGRFACRTTSATKTAPPQNRTTRDAPFHPLQRLSQADRASGDSRKARKARRWADRCFRVVAAHRNACYCCRGYTSRITTCIELLRQPWAFPHDRSRYEKYSVVLSIAPFHCFSLAIASCCSSFPSVYTDFMQDCGL
jgi:hypothetical protein